MKRRLTDYELVDDYRWYSTLNQHPLQLIDTLPSFYLKPPKWSTMKKKFEKHREVNDF